MRTKHRLALAALTPGALAALSPGALAQSEHLFLETPPGYDACHFGSSVDGMDDANGDGVPDLVIGSCTSTFVMSGADGTLLFEFGGSYQGSGTVASFAGDVNGDGRGDAIGIGQNAVEVRSGGDGSLLHQYTITGHWALAVCDLDDVNGDGMDDFLIAWAYDEVELRSGADGGVLRSHPMRAVRIRNAGDLDADGTMDFVAVVDRNGTTLVQAHSGADGSLLAAVGYGGSHPGALIPEGAGDVDGDGRDDFVIGDTQQYEARVYSGAGGALLHHFLPADDGQVHYGFGWGVCGAGDIDLDGQDDVAVRDGHLGVVAYSGRTGARLYTFDDPTGGFSWDLAFVGDANGDGFPEIIAGSELESGSPGYGGGWARVISPCPVPPLVYCPAAANSHSAGGAILAAVGSTSVADGNLGLFAAEAVPNQTGLFFYGAGFADLPFGDGYLCVGPGGYQLFRLGPPVHLDGAGAATIALPLEGGAPDDPAGKLAAGSAWNFQLWYRDPAGPGGTGFNTSNAVRLTLCP